MRKEGKERQRTEKKGNEDKERKGEKRNEEKGRQGEKKDRAFEVRRKEARRGGAR